MGSYQVPISAKGIVFEGDSVWLRSNERNEWELPGGKVEQGEQSVEAVVRELREELGFEVTVTRIVHASLYSVEKSLDESQGVLVLCYLCKLISKTGHFETKGEAGTVSFQAFPLAKIEKLTMPNFYKEAIHLAKV